MKATSLLAECHGPERCFYCGNPAGDIKLKLSSSFIDWWSVPYPSSTVICAGCEVALREKIEIPGKDKLQKTRNYSWLVTRSEQRPFTKADKAEILSVLLSPPEPPWAFALADSGQKHLLYRTDVNEQAEPPYRVQLEEVAVDYTPDQLMQRLALCKRVVAAVGVSNAREAEGVGPAIAYSNMHGECDGWCEWESIRCEPLSRLALFVCPNSEACKDELRGEADAAGVPSEAGRTGGRGGGQRSLF